MMTYIFLRIVFSSYRFLKKVGWFAGVENCYDYKVYKSHIDVLYI